MVMTASTMSETLKSPISMWTLWKKYQGLTFVAVEEYLEEASHHQSEPEIVKNRYLFNMYYLYFNQR